MWAACKKTPLIANKVVIYRIWIVKQALSRPAWSKALLTEISTNIRCNYGRLEFATTQITACLDVGAVYKRSPLDARTHAQVSSLHNRSEWAET